MKKQRAMHLHRPLLQSVEEASQSFAAAAAK